jgi:hypothetical protein
MNGGMRLGQELEARISVLSLGYHRVGVRYRGKCHSWYAIRLSNYILISLYQKACSMRVL